MEGETFMSKHLLTMLLLLFFAGTAFAHTSGRVDKVCPLCSTAFTAEVDMSGTQFGMRLDLKPIGPIAAPWRVPVCPQCHFVLFSDELTPEVLEQCREIVGSQGYISQVERSSHFLLGLLYEGLKENPMTVAQTFLRASWQEEETPELLREDLERSLGHFEAFLQLPPPAESGDSDPENNPRATAQLLKAEILRRLGRFDQASVFLDELKVLPAFQDSFVGKIVDYQIRLCQKQDDQPHQLSEMESAPPVETVN